MCKNLGKGGEDVIPPVEVTEDSIRVVLKELCIPVNLKGYEYLVKALLISSNNPSRSVTCKEIYASVKDELQLNLSIKSIETAIREAVSKATSLVENDTFKKIFGGGKTIICRGKATPSNTIFIRGVTEYLLVHERRLKYEKIHEQTAKETISENS